MVVEAVVMVRQRRPRLRRPAEGLLEGVERRRAEGPLENLTPVLLRHSFNVRGGGPRMMLMLMMMMVGLGRRRRHRHMAAHRIKVRAEAAAAGLLIDYFLVAEQTLAAGGYGWTIN